MRKNLNEEINRVKSLMLFEVSNKILNQLTTKFKKSNPRLTDEEILGYINEFERYKSSLDATKRDITKYTFNELKSTIDSIKEKQKYSEAYNHFKKSETKIERVLLNKAIKNFYEINSLLPKKFQDIKVYKFADLKDLLYGQATDAKPNYKTLITKKLTEKFLKELGEDRKPDIEFYINKYIRGLDLIPIDGPPVDKMSFDEFEHFIDGYIKDEAVFTSTEINTSAEILHDDENITIYHAHSKKDSVPFGFLASWCISRQGGGNLFYNYRLSRRLTIYFVINKTLPSKDVNSALVILVEPSSGSKIYNIADKTNSGVFAGSTTFTWDKVIEKCPYLDEFKSIFVQKPLTSEESSEVDQYMRVDPGVDPYSYFDKEIDKVNKWLELRSYGISDEQFSNIPDESKKTYITLGYALSGGMIRSSSPSVISYYVVKRLDKLKNTNLSSLSPDDIALLNSNESNAKVLKRTLKDKYAQEINQSFDKKVTIEYPNSTVSKYLALYGFDEIFSLIPNDVELLDIINKSNDNISIKLPDNILKFKNLTELHIKNFINSLPEKIGELENLIVLSLHDNPDLKKIPNSVLTSKNLDTIILNGYTGSLPNGFEDVYEEIPGENTSSKWFIRL